MRYETTFCSVRNFNGKIQTRSIQSIIDELLFLRIIKYQTCDVVNDDLLYNTGRTIELFNEMVKQDVGILGMHQTNNSGFS